MKRYVRLGFWHRLRHVMEIACPSCRRFRKTKRYPEGRHYLGVGGWHDDPPKHYLLCMHCGYQEEFANAKVAKKAWDVVKTSSYMAVRRVLGQRRDDCSA